jgi:ABC-type multidrug transport system permease subunit
VNAFNTVIGVYEAERNMFYRHKASLMYSKGAIALATTIVEIPFILSSTMIFVVCFYFLIGFSPVAWQFFLFYLFFAMSMASWTFLGQVRFQSAALSIL